MKVIAKTYYALKQASLDAVYLRVRLFADSVIRHVRRAVLQRRTLTQAGLLVMATLTSADLSANESPISDAGLDRTVGLEELSPDEVASSLTIDVSSGSSSNISGGYVWQSFTAPDNADYLRSVSLKYNSVDAITGDRTALIYEGEGDSGELLGEVTVDAITSTWTNFDFGAIPIVPGQTYTIACWQSRWAYSNSDPYPDGQSSNSNASRDYMFQLYTSSKQYAAIALDGSGSSDPEDGNNLSSYLWAEISGLGVTLTDADAALATASGLEPGNAYTFELTVTDQEGASDSDSVTITTHEAPTADAGSAIVTTTGSATLTGSGSDPEDGTNVTYWWEETSGLGATLANADSASATASGLIAGNTYVFRLTVTDQSGATAADEVEVYATTAPVADAGADETLGLESLSPDQITPTLSANMETGIYSSDSEGAIWQSFTAPAGADYLHSLALGYDLSTESNFFRTVTVYEGEGDTGAVLGTATAIVDEEWTTFTFDGIPLTEGQTYSFGSDQQYWKYAINSFYDGGHRSTGDSHDAYFRLYTYDAAARFAPIVLTGSGSDAEDGSNVTYQWVETSGLGAALTNADAADVTIGSLLPGETYTFSLTVTDQVGAANTDTVVITTHRAPIVDAGPDIAEIGSSSVTLSGSGSDPDGGAVTYQWIQISGLTLTLSNADTEDLTVSGLVAGNSYTFQLTVTDEENASAADFVSIYTSQLPIVNAGADIIANSDSVTLNGTGSNPDGGDVSYLWEETSGLGAILANADTANPTASGLVVGATYTFQLTLTNQVGASDTDEVEVYVNAAPSADAGSDIITVNSSVTLTGSGSDAEDGTDVTYLWEETSGLGATLANADSASATASALIAGNAYVFRLTVTDQDGSTATDEVAVYPTTAPTADAGVGGDVGLRFLNPDEVSPTLSAEMETGIYVNTTQGEIWQSITTPDGADYLHSVAIGYDLSEETGFERTVTIYEGEGTDGAVLGTITAVVDAEWTTFVLDDAIPLTAGQVYSIATDRQYWKYAINDYYDGGYRSINTGGDSYFRLYTYDTESAYAQIVLAGDGSDAEDGSNVTYQWTETSGLGATLTNADTADVTLSGLVPGNAYTFSLTVTDQAGISSTDTVTIDTHQAPVVDAGPDVVATGDSVILSGSGSDPDGGSVTYQWTESSGSLSLTNADTTDVTASGLVIGSTYTFLLTVTDEKGATGMDEVTVFVTTAPTADAGQDQTVNLLSLDLFTPSLSLEVDSSTTGSSSDGFVWQSFIAPDSADVLTSIALNYNNTHLITDSRSAFIYEGEGADGQLLGEVTVDTISAWTTFDFGAIPIKGGETYTILGSQSRWAFSGADAYPEGHSSSTDADRDYDFRIYTLSTGAVPIILSGSGSDLEDGTNVIYEWMQDDDNPTAALTNADTAQVTINGLLPGYSYTFVLTVTDQDGASTSNSVEILGNTIPTAEAGSDVDANSGSATLSGSGSDPDGDAFTYLWEQITGLDVIMTNADTANPSISGLLADNDYTFQLTITDTYGASDTDDVLVSVESASSIYDDWVSAHVANDADKDFNAEIFGNITNGIAFLVGVSPEDLRPSDLGTVESSSAAITYKFRRHDQALAFNPVVQYSSDMIVWSTITLDSDIAGISVTEIDNGYGTDDQGVGVDEVMLEVDTAIHQNIFIRQQISDLVNE
ncbi:PKD domain-containing protein [Cerasicoccus frondis]|uniref:PKD domain-containing protein n=1 Tax=Cerasicoccus frondis TaxID=490090 RepID=UPI0028525569|nr:REJ domain-containing protein [Cerasicoccus frondis]